MTQFASRSRRLFLEGIELALHAYGGLEANDRGTGMLPRGLRRVIHRDRLGGGWVVELVFGLGGHVGGECDE